MEKPVLKFWSHDLNRPLVDKVHTHPYWQMEYIIQGAGTRVFDRNDMPVELKNGMFVLIPPLVPHRFSRIGTGTETFCCIPANCLSSGGSGVRRSVLSPRRFPCWNGTGCSNIC